MDVDYIHILMDEVLRTYSTSILITVLTIISIVAWTMIIDVVFTLRKCFGKNSSFIKHYELFCISLKTAPLHSKTELKLAKMQSNHLLARSTKNIKTILLLSSVAPLVGLLGTVDGMIDTFRVMASVDLANTAHMTDGISKALLTTQYGLTVAIPTVLAGGVLHRKTAKLRNSLRSIALHTLESQPSGEHYEMAPQK